jgi:hypothetical protein
MSVVVDQITTAPDRRDLRWLRAALQSAVELEHATLPLYTAAMLSLEVQNYPTYNTIRSVLMEEMVHMAIAANMLAALGGSPRIRTLDPGYPCRGLPGGAEPDLHVGLAALSPAQLAQFMRIEAPAALLPAACLRDGYPTIGLLYETIRAAIVEDADEVRAAVETGGPAIQVGDDIGFAIIDRTSGVDAVEQLCAGIDEILEQGEGSTAGTIHTGERYQDEESHYARFAELHYGRLYRDPGPGVVLNRSTEPEFFQGTDIPWPGVVNTLAVPRDGYDALLARDVDGAAVRGELEQFDAVYTGMLEHLDAMWNGSAEGQWPTFGDAVTAMVELRVLSCFTIMRRPVPAELVADLATLYPDEIGTLAHYTDLDRPVFYGPRFRNTNA